MSSLPAPLQTVVQRVPRLRLAVRFGLGVFERWNELQGSLLAAALAFYGLLSLFPLVLAGALLLARFATNNGALLGSFSAFVGSFFPASSGVQVAAQVHGAVGKMAAGPSPWTTSLLAIASLLWSGRAYFDTLAGVLNRVFPGAVPRSFVQQQLTMAGLMVGSGALFLLSSATTLALSVAQSWAMRAPDLFLNRAPLAWSLLGKFAAWLLTLLMFWLLYRFAPNRTPAPPRRPVWAGALFSALAFETAKWLFARFLGNVTRYEATYGSVAGVILTMMWLYFASMIVLLGATIGATWELLRPEPEGGAAHAKPEGGAAHAEPEGGAAHATRDATLGEAIGEADAA